MRTICTILAAAMIMAACTSSKKLLEKGQYDRAIIYSVKKLRKDPGDSKDLATLKEAYTKANFFDQDRINYLQKEGNSQNWVEIFNLYSNMDARQKTVETLPSSLLNQFDIKNYNDEIIRAKTKAADVSYNNGVMYLNRKTRLDARKAYDEFQRVKQLYPNYKDIDRKLEDALYLGTSNILFRVENHSQVVLPADFDYELNNISLKELDKQWLNFDTTPDSTRHYDFYITLDIKHIRFSPERVDRSNYSESKEIQDGTEYVLDKNGNVERDSLGNDIKVPRMATVTANITDVYQHKRASISGSIDYYNLISNQMIKTQDVAVNAVFAHHSATVTGNTKALSDSTKAKLNSKPIPFPSNEGMLMNAAKILKDRSKDLIYANSGLFQQYYDTRDQLQ